MTTEKRRTYQATYRATHRNEARANCAAYHVAHRDEILANKVAYRAVNLERERARQRLRKYGLTTEVFNSMLASQGGTCAACQHSEWGPKGPCVDHNHVTGVVRGILCHRCNLISGMAGDDPVILRAVADYIEEGKA